MPSLEHSKELAEAIIMLLKFAPYLLSATVGIFVVKYAVCPFMESFGRMIGSMRKGGRN